MRNEKGITLVTLVITILVLVIIAGVGIRVAMPIVDEADLQNVITELMLVQAWWKTEIERVNFDGTSKLSVGLVSQEEEDKGKLIEEYKYKEEDGIEFYKLPQEALNEMGLNKLNAQDGYIVNYDNDDIRIEAGYVFEDKTYYKLSELQGL